MAFMALSGPANSIRHATRGTLETDEASDTRAPPRYSPSFVRSA